MDEKGQLSWSEYWRLYKDGAWQSAVGCNPGVPALAKVVSLRYPNSSTSIPDQIRAEEFLRELGEREKSGEMPHVVVLTLNRSGSAVEHGAASKGGCSQDWLPHGAILKHCNEMGLFAASANHDRDSAVCG